ncbi:MAG: Gfo/Idh/MocA family oxidoreductase [Verrucomicrobia bacterium]|nr:Gfo/Idh/MocA family oxidoreductase [Verrucomicrobiota bacterium]
MNKTQDSTNTPEPASSRRDFIRKTTTAIAGGAVATKFAFPSVTFGAADTKKLKIGLVGCGGRGTGAAVQAMTADDNVELTAIADLYEDKIMKQQRLIAKQNPKSFNVQHTFTGLDSYKKVIDSGVDVILLVTPPAFRPQQFKAAVEAGIHCFVEKPIATDVAGINDFIATGKIAAQKNLSVLCGLCYRYSQNGRDLFKRIHNGDIGEIKAVHSTYYASLAYAMPPEEDRPDGMSDTEWQLKNWHNYTWASADGLVEQAIHSIDRASWAMNDEIPVACTAMGGRQRPNNVSNTYDHYHVTYEYKNGTRAHVDWSQYGAGTYKENLDHIIGADGTATFGDKKAEIVGKNPYRFRSRKKTNKYQVEHDEFFASIRSGKRHSDEEWVARSTRLGIMARHAAYTGKKITWEDISNSKEKLVPDDLKLDGKLPVRPMAIPGVAETQNV